MNILRFVILAVIMSVVVSLAGVIGWQSRDQWPELLVPLLVYAVLFPVAFGAILLLAWTLTENSRKNEFVFFASKGGWVIGLAIWILLVFFRGMIEGFPQFHPPYPSSVPLESMKGALLPGIVIMLASFTFGGFFLWLIQRLVQHTVVGFLVALLVVGATNGLYYYLFPPQTLQPLGVVAVMAAPIGLIIGGVVYTMLTPGRALPLLRGDSC